MRKLFLITFFVFLIIGCDDNFSPFGDYKEDYVLSAILQGDSLVQTVTISENYIDTDFSNIKTNRNLWVKDAIITLSYDEEAFIFNQLGNDIVKYEINNFTVPIDKVIKIEALLPNGRWVRSFTKSPKEILFRGNSDQFIPPDDNRKFFSIIWQSFERDIVFIPKLTMDYSINKNGILEKHTIELPQNFVSSNGEEIPVFPSPRSQIGISFQMNALDKSLKDIYCNENNKSSYFINKALKFELIILDQNLSSYYLITNNILDNYSVRLNTAEFSNIENGLGIFGSFIKQEYFMYLTEEYIYSFGYRVKTN